MLIKFIQIKKSEFINFDHFIFQAKCCLIKCFFGGPTFKLDRKDRRGIWNGSSRCLASTFKDRKGRSRIHEMSTRKHKKLTFEIIELFDSETGQRLNNNDFLGSRYCFSAPKKRDLQSKNLNSKTSFLKKEIYKNHRAINILVTMIMIIIIVIIIVIINI